MFVKCICTTCNGHIEFDAEHVGQTIRCPHCGLDTVLYHPPQAPPAGTDTPSTTDHGPLKQCGSGASNEVSQIEPPIIPQPPTLPKRPSRLIVFAAVAIVMVIIVLLFPLSRWIGQQEKLAEAESLRQRQTEVSSYDQVLFSSYGFVVLDVTEEGARVHDALDDFRGLTGNDIFISGLRKVFSDRRYTTQLIARQEGEFTYATVAGGHRRIPLYRLLPADYIGDWKQDHPKEAGTIDWRLF